MQRESRPFCFTKIKFFLNFNFIIIFFCSIIISSLLSPNVLSAPLIVQFQNISDFDERRYFDYNFYPEITSKTLKSNFGSFYLFCVISEGFSDSSCFYDGQTPPDVTIDPPDFTYPVRVIIPKTLIEETIKRYAGRLDLSIPTSSMMELLPELGEGLKSITDVTIVSVELIKSSLSVNLGASDFKGECWDDLPYIAVADMKLRITAFYGKDIFLNVSFKVPITVDAISWLPDVRHIEGERAGGLRRTTLHILFHSCFSEVEPYSWEEINIGRPLIITNIKNQKVSDEEKNDFERRLRKFLSYFIYRYLGTLDFNPISFPILDIPSAVIKKAYTADVLFRYPAFGDNSIKSLALEFDNRGTEVLPYDPIISLYKAPNHVVKHSFVEIKVKGDDKAVKAAISLDGGAWMGWKEKDQDGFFSFTITNLLQGQRDILILGQNIYGNINEVPLKFSFLVDRIPPTIDVYVPEYSNKIYAKIRGQDNSGGKISVSIRIKDENGREVSEINKTFLGETEVESEDVPEGKYTLLIQAKDEAGNTTGFFSRKILVDKQPPTIVPVFIPPPKSKYDSLKIIVRISDNFFPRGYIEYFLEEVVSERRRTCFSQWGFSDSQEVFVPYGEVKLSGFESGKKYHLCFRARDPAGNTGQIFESDFFVDLIPPVIVFDSFPSRITFDSDIDVVISVQDDSSSPDNVKLYWAFSKPDKVKSIFISGGVWRFKMSGLEDGRYKFSAYAIDEAGNVSQPREMEFIVDTTLRRIGGGKGIRLGCSSFSPTYSHFSLLPLIFYIFLMRKMMIKIKRAPEPRTKNGR